MRRAFGLWLVAWCATACGGAERRVVEPPPRKSDGVAQKVEAAAEAQREVAEAAELDGGPHFGGSARARTGTGMRSTRRRGASSTAAAPATLPAGSPFTLTSGGAGWKVVGTYHARDWTSMVLEAPAGEVGLREHFRKQLDARCRKVAATSSGTVDEMRCDDDPDAGSRMSVVIERTASRPMVDLHWR